MTVAVQPVSSVTLAGTSSRWMRTGTRCGSLTQLKVGLTLASMSPDAERSRSETAAAIAFDLPP